MALSLAIAGHFGFGKKTETAGTAIVRTVPPKRNYYARITTLAYTAAGTAHTVTVQRASGSTTVASAAAAAQADVVLAADPGPAGNGIAANDYLVIEKPDGTVHTGVVSAWNAGTKTVTLTANVPTGGFAAKARVWFFGVVGDSFHADHQYNGTASVTTTYDDDVGGVDGSAGRGEPLLVHSNNATAAGTIEQVSGVYCVR